jgi:predicted RNase H-like nuclease
LKVAGIDGCKAGWIVVHYDHGQFADTLVTTQKHLLEIFIGHDRVFIDIPIGIASNTTSRECDRLLRDKLGTGYRNSVFNPPVREALYAGTYQDACQINYRITGKKISKQCWNICPKIRELDGLMRDIPTFKEKILECHPELLFKILNNRNSLIHKKKTEDGKRLRLSLLEKKNRGVKCTIKRPSKDTGEKY